MNAEEKRKGAHACCAFAPLRHCVSIYGSGHVCSVALRRAPRRTVEYACGALGRAPWFHARLRRLAANPVSKIAWERARRAQSLKSGEYADETSAVPGRRPRSHFHVSSGGPKTHEGLVTNAGFRHHFGRKTLDECINAIPLAAESRRRARPAGYVNRPRCGICGCFCLLGGH
jgi:hypothetical protein